MPGRPHHTDKMKRCVEEVAAKGHDESSAYAICTTSLQKAGEPIFEGAESRSAEENMFVNGAEMHHLHLLGATGMARTEIENGKEYLVVPVVALMEGVIHAVNADTPEFVSYETLEKAAASWNGRPVTLGHPVKNGKQCSANLPEILEAHGIGIIRNSHVDLPTKKLLQEAWIEKSKAKKLHPEMYDRLLNNKTEEVSVGAFVITDSTPGDYNGKSYKASWRETAGDHLAFLPGGRGACSVAMGCGTHRAAMRVCEDHLEVLAALPEKAQVVLEKEKKMKHQDCPMCNGTGSKNGNPCEACDGNGEIRVAGGPGSGNFGHSGRPGEVGGSGNGGRSGDNSGDKAYAKIAASLENKGYRKHSESSSSIIYRKDYDTPEEAQRADSNFYKSHKQGDSPVGYSRTLGKQHEVDIITTGETYYQWRERADKSPQAKKDEEDWDRMWERLNKKRTLEEASAPIQASIKSTDSKSIPAAAKDVSAKPQLKAACGCSKEAASCGCKHAGVKTMEKATRAELIAALVTDRFSGFNEVDEAMLETASDSRLEDFKALSDARKAEERARDKQATELTKSNARLSIAEERLRAAQESPSEEEWLSKAPPKIKALLDAHKAEEDALRASLVSQLKDCGANTEAELKAMPIEQLKTLAAYARIEIVDFSGRGIPQERNASSKNVTYAPPDPYGPHLDKVRQASKTVN